MSPTVTWTTPADIKRQLEICWNRGQMLRAPLVGESLFPLPLQLRRPDRKAVSDRFDEVRRWIRELEEGSKARQGFGYEIEWTEIHHQQLGRNRVPLRVLLPTEHDALCLVGRSLEAERFRTLTEATLACFPTLGDWLARNPLKALQYAEDWGQILRVLNWFRSHPGFRLYLRQLDIAGVDTKFIEARKGLLSELLDLVLPPEAVDTRFSGAGGFEQRYGLIAKPSLIRFRFLDHRLYLSGLSDLSVTSAEFSRLKLPVKRVFITENDVNGLAFPNVSESLVIFGLGYGLERLAEVRWFEQKTLYYWGDVDTHGFAILDRLRAAFPEARSFLMDRETLMAHRELWVQEQEGHAGALSRLSAAEQSLFDDLRHDHLGPRVRLEQERISFGWLEKALEELPPPEGASSAAVDYGAGSVDLASRPG